MAFTIKIFIRVRSSLKWRKDNTLEKCIIPLIYWRIYLPNITGRTMMRWKYKEKPVKNKTTEIWKRSRKIIKENPDSPGSPYASLYKKPTSFAWCPISENRHSCLQPLHFRFRLIFNPFDVGTVSIEDE